MSLRTNIVALAATCLLARGAYAQAPAAAPNPVRRVARHIVVHAASFALQRRDRGLSGLRA